ncbi:normal mucosa of esophagus-specific gene 1 protein-like [Saccoglossus kowalevskii]|uniref:Normal mucosa of esophagus-specific gene 1 protein-like n=1 Tax=Saccoglossus kowalevskii TaxID=10224 RepID=A0ABM0M094_SACKO|nr:PREDICTED: normal mucosa of esophagus-specific gene 1 protein-like [Saccoglossus kowalevskii]
MVGGVCVMAGSYITYAVFTKSDVVVNKSGNPWPWQNVDSSKPQKLITVQQAYKPIPELEALRRDIGSPAHPRAASS